MATTQDICSQCEEPLELQEGEFPMERDGDLWCDDCYHEEFEFTCSWCEEYGDVDDQHTYLVVFDADEAGIALPGIYLVQAFPYYTAPLIGHGWLENPALKWWGALPPTLPVDSYYPCGHLCAGCQKRMLQDIAERQRIVHDVR